MKLDKFLIPAVFSSVLLLLIFCSSPKIEGNGAAVIRVENVSLSVNDFRNAYTMDPAFPGKRKGAAGLMEYARELADGMLCAQLAEAEKLWEQDFFKRQLQYYSQKRIIRALYRREILPLAEKSGNSENISLENQLREYRVLNFFSGEESALKKIAVEFQRTGNFAFGNIDSSRVKISDLGWVTVGQLDRDLEKALLQLKPGALSMATSSKWGYHLLYLKETRKKSFADEDQKRIYLKKISRQIRIRREKILAQQYLDQLLTPQQIVVKKKGLQKLARRLNHLSKESGKSVLLQNKFILTDSGLEKLFAGMDDRDKNEILIISKAKQWTVSDYLEMWRNVPAEQRGYSPSTRALANQIRLLLRNYFLLRRAGQLHCSDDPKFQAEIQRFKEKLAYRYYLNRVGRDPEISSSTADFHDFLQEKFPQTEVWLDSAFIRREAATIEWEHPVRMLTTERDF